MEYGEKFKKSVFGGFNRQDVLKCFEVANKEHQNILSRYEQTIENLQKENDGLKAQVEELQKTCEEKAQAVVEEEKKLSDALQVGEKLNIRAGELQRELTSQKALNSKLLMERDVLEANNKQLEAKLQELNEQQANEKASFEIGEIMMEAKNTADKIVARAREKSEQLRETAKREASQTEKQFDQTRERLSAVIDTFRSFSSDVMQNMEQLQRDLKTAKAHINVEQEHAKDDVPQPEKKGDPKKGFDADSLFRR